MAKVSFQSFAVFFLCAMGVESFTTPPFRTTVPPVVECLSEATPCLLTEWDVSSNTCLRMAVDCYTTFYDSCPPGQVEVPPEPGECCGECVPDGETKTTTMTPAPPPAPSLTPTNGKFRRHVSLDSLRVRLMNGTIESNLEGRVEVFYSGEFWRKTGDVKADGDPVWVKDSIEEPEWGTVGLWGFDDRDAAAICRTLGRPGGVHVAHALVDGVATPPYGEGSGRVWLEDVRCQGDEQHLSQCLTEDWLSGGGTGWGKVHHDQHRFDVGVKCSES